MSGLGFRPPAKYRGTRRIDHHPFHRKVPGLMRIETGRVCFLQIVNDNGLWARYVGPVLSHGAHPEYSDRKQLKERSL